MSDTTDKVDPIKQKETFLKHMLFGLLAAQVGLGFALLGSSGPTPENPLIEFSGHYISGFGMMLTFGSVIFVTYSFVKFFNTSRN